MADYKINTQNLYINEQEENEIKNTTTTKHIKKK